MSVVGHQPPPFFKRGPAPLAKLFFFLAISLTLMIGDLRFRYLEVVRQVVSVITYPLQRAAAAPVALVLAGSDYFTTLESLQAENATLKRERLNDSTTLIRHNHLMDENKQLRALLEMRERQPVKSIAGEILFATRDPFRRRVILDKGAAQGILAGQSVVDALGVVGQVTRVYPLQSEVTLLTDKDQAIPVQIVRNGLRAATMVAGDDERQVRQPGHEVEKHVEVLVWQGIADGQQKRPGGNVFRPHGRGRRTGGHAQLDHMHRLAVEP